MYVYIDERCYMGLLGGRKKFKWWGKYEREIENMWDDVEGKFILERRKRLVREEI